MSLSNLSFALRLHTVTPDMLVGKGGTIQLGHDRSDIFTSTPDTVFQIQKGFTVTDEKQSQEEDVFVSLESC